MDHFEQTPGTDHGQGESDEALLQKMEQEYRQDDRRFRPLTTRLRELRDDNPMSLTDAATYLGKVTGRKPHVSTLWRWCQKGCKGVRLDSICVGGKRFVTVAAIERFIDESTNAQDGRPRPPSGQSPAPPSPASSSGQVMRHNERRKKEIKAVRDRLDEITGRNKAISLANRSA
jgi:hypothetical protein